MRINLKDNRRRYMRRMLDEIESGEREYYD